MRFEKIREIDWLHLRLQQFDKLGYELHARTGNQLSENIREIIQGNLIFGGFQLFETTVMVKRRAHSGKLYDPQSDGQSFSLLIG